MPNVNVDPSYPNHPKTIRLRSRLGRGAEGYPVRLWCYAALTRPDDGHLPEHTPGEVESLAGWDGPPGECVAALLAVRFLDALPGGGGFALHNWPRWQGHLKMYRERASANARVRWAKVAAETAAANAEADRLAAQAARDASGNATGITSGNAAGVPVGMLRYGKATEGTAPKQARPAAVPRAAKPAEPEPDGKPKPPPPAEFLDVIPEAFRRVPDVVRAWTEFEQMRRQRKPKVVRSSAVATWRKLGKFSAAEAVALIDRATAGTWQGIVFPEQRPGAILTPGGRLPPASKPPEERKADAAAEGAAKRKRDADRAAASTAYESACLAAVAKLDADERERRRAEVVANLPEGPGRAVYAKADPLVNGRLAYMILGRDVPPMPDILKSKELPRGV